ncbi:MAG: hypothetical protein HOF21_16575 [Nitrospina sp.]|nr:hypothetical protein [Nitrospina sp.]
MNTHYLIDILVLLAGAVVAVPIFQRLGLGSILGYLIAGIIVGPWGFGFIERVEEIRHIAEFGVVFLLFIIGVELNPSRLWALRRTVFVLGSAQVILTGFVLTVPFLLFGVPEKSAIIAGFGLALSSTAFGIQILTEGNDLGTPAGRTAFSVLLFQDLAVVPLLTLVSLLANETSLVESIGFAGLDTIIAVTAVFLFGKFLLTPSLRLVAGSRNSEVFIAAAVLVVLGAAWLMEEVGLSMGLGAFLAGMTLADSDYRHQVVADIQPFRGILLGLFFMSVGMSVDFSLLGQQALLIIGLVVGLLLIKAVLLLGLCRLTGVGSGTSIRVSLLLSQSGEFGFVLFGLATTTGVMATDLSQLLTVVVVLTMAVTPWMARIGEYIERRLAEKKTQYDISIAKVDEKPKIIVAGFGRVGKRIARILKTSGVSYLALDNNSNTVERARAEGFNVFYGDASRHDVLKTAGAEDASVLVITLNQVEPTERLVHVIRHHYLSIPIYARGYNIEHCKRLLKAGANVSISETLEVSLQLGGAALEANGISSEEVRLILQAFRQKYYEEGDTPLPIED